MIVVNFAFISPAALAESNVLYCVVQLSNGANNLFGVASGQPANKVFLIGQFGHG